jgi:hypothetical protein
MAGIITDQATYRYRVTESAPEPGLMAMSWDCRWPSTRRTW